MGLKIRVGIIEGSGHIYLELIRLLKAHPLVEIVYLQNGLKTLNKDADNKIALTDINGLPVSRKNNNEVNLLFITGKNDSGKIFLSNYILPKKIKIICLTGEFRTVETANCAGRKFTYGLPELKKELIQKADNVSVPGAMAACVVLGLLPVAYKKLLQDVYTTGISGSTEENIGVSENKGEKIHKVKSAQINTDNTLKEIKKPLLDLSKDTTEPSIHFVPWKGEFSRGIFVTSQLKCTESLSEMYYIFENFYKDRTFIHISKKPVYLKKVINTNDCFINLEMAGDILVVHSAIDNLVKGAAGQAIQNMNLMFGYDEELGLLPKQKKESKN